MFEEAYKKLNSAQREAVDTIEGPVMVVAGPGTGKTQILTLRIANIVQKTDTPADAILALTFTESGARAMRKRLLEIMGSGAYKVAIHTFHGFCNDVIQKYPEEFPVIIGSRPALPVDQIGIMQEIIERTDLSRLKPYGDPMYYLRPALSSIQELKRENISPDLFEERVRQSEKDFAARDDVYHTKGAHKGKMKGDAQNDLKQIEKNKELVMLYREYERELRAHKWYDYEDMILEVVRVLEKNEDLLLRLQETHQYILADEHQDANSAQNRLLELLSSFHQNPNLFIVGDEKQAIFRFQGASLENFLYFKRLYPEARRIDLRENYRSTQGILDAAHSLILKAPGDTSLRVELRAAAAGPAEKIMIRSYARGEDESREVAQSIAELLKHDVSSHEIAVLYRDNKDALSISAALGRCGVPYGIESDENILFDPVVQQFVLLLRAVADYGNETLLAEALHLPFLSFDELDIFKILSYAKRERRHLLPLLASLKDLEAVGIGGKDVFRLFAEKLGDWHKMSKTVSVLQVMERVFEDSGMLQSTLQRKGVLEVFEKVSGMLKEAEEFIETHRVSTLAAFLEHIDLLLNHAVPLKKRRTGASHGVRLMTAHRSKGLEFEYVFVLGVYDGHWGNRTSRELFKLPLSVQKQEDSSSDDERRLLYVAITRAKRRATLSYPRVGPDGQDLLPARFLEEIDASYKVEEAVEAKPETPEDFAVRFRVPKETDMREDNKQFLNQLFQEQGLSVTALNNYLSCPWKYFYTNLIRIPRSQDASALYGTAVHSTLKTFFDGWAKGEDMPRAEFLSRFQHNIREMPLGESELRAAEKRGMDALGGYYDTYKNEWTRTIQNEFSIQGIQFDDLFPLRGALDKIEFLAGNDVNVVDYKTSKPKTRNEIMGQTKNSSGDQYRQLVFYKLLLERFDAKKYHMVSGEIDFVQPTEKGQYKKERFTVTQEEVVLLEAEIRRVAKEIMDLSFWNTQCDEKDCEYCKLRGLVAGTA